jgi:molybdate transport system ATP-binding protein
VSIRLDADGHAGLRVAGSTERGTLHLDVDLAVAPGEVLGVLGPNGAGKTTLVRTLAGLHTLDSGYARLDGQLLDDPAGSVFVPPERRPVGVVFQNYRLFPRMTVRDNVAFAPRCAGLGKRAARARADEWIARLGLSDLAGLKPAQLSGGQGQRVALARALAAEPGLLLLDEPLAALDARTKQQIRAELRKHLREFAGATLLITHDPLDAMILTDRLVVIEAGRVVQSGTPAQVARRPATGYVAKLVGLNLYRGRIGERGRIALDGGGELVSTPTDEVGPADTVLAALRPNAIAVHTTAPEHSSPRNAWPGTVVALEMLTDRVRVEVAGEPTALVDLTPDAVADLGLSEGSAVWLSAKATDVDVYPDPSSA